MKEVEQGNDGPLQVQSDKGSIGEQFIRERVELLFPDENFYFFKKPLETYTEE